MSTINFSDFTKVEMRVGTIVHAEVFQEAKIPAYKVTIDFGEFGIKKSSAQITKLYAPSDLIGKQIIAVVNFPPKQIANFMSECLILGVVGNENFISLLSPNHKMENGLRIG
ncbi:tRNA-binding protein [Flavobacterium urocaniciphilum]|uniref:tRNA-binding protein n=1 Tax=Flavobacterium urocaniciphilum TaxID=1299341 RepID=A0A1H9CQF6_9FLAO|nr:tRNA-binding protein [Flavobacterium urocaniciphilum]SEQ03452.1 tRNA-binding protein [Flavobacterium urocaniciphilum]